MPGFRSGLAVCAVLLMAVGCAAAPVAAPAAPQTSRTSTSTALATTTAVDLNQLAKTHQFLAKKETERLVSLAQLPPTAKRVSSGPPQLNAPTMGTPGTDALVDTVEYFTVPMPLTKAVAWFTAHKPAGLTYSGGSGGPESPNLSTGIDFAAADSDAWTHAQLEIGVFPIDSSTTAWRVDGLAEWLDPRPVPDLTKKGRIAVTVAGGCPPTDNLGADNTALADVTATDAGTVSLLPHEMPTAALVCDYYDGNADRKPFGLKNHRVVKSAEAAKLASVVNGIGLQHEDNMLSTCGTQSPVSGYLLAFSYADRKDSSLWYSMEGCPFVSNGTITATSLTPQFFDLLDGVH